MSGESHAGGPRRSSSQPWPSVALSVVGSAVAVVAVGSLCALVYPILKELRAERVRGENGIEERMLDSQSPLRPALQWMMETSPKSVKNNGDPTDSASLIVIKCFWSILVLSVLVGCVCCVFSWTLTYFDSYQPGMQFPTPLTLSSFRGVSDHGFHVNYGMAALNGIMAMLTVIWSLS